MEYNDKLASSGEKLEDETVDSVSGGANIDRVICCTCGAEVKLNGPMMSQYYNNNICPRCHGRLKSW